MTKTQNLLSSTSSNLSSPSRIVEETFSRELLSEASGWRFYSDTLLSTTASCVPMHSQVLTNGPVDKGLWNIYSILNHHCMHMQVFTEQIVFFSVCACMRPSSNPHRLSHHHPDSWQQNLYQIYKSIFLFLFLSFVTRLPCLQ